MSKASKHRFCPALGREISPRDCGESRHSRHACPAACPHDPFALANYSALLATDEARDRRMLKWMFDEARDRAALEREWQRALAAESGHVSHAFVAWNLFVRRDERGITCAQRWAEAGFPGLDNDDRVFVQAKARMRVVLLEVHRVLDAQTVEGIDLLAPDADPIVIVDRNLAARASRFATLLAWAFPLPHFWRLNGTALSISDVPDFDADEVVIETVRHLGGPTEVAALRLWLAEHFVRIGDALLATAKARHRLMLAGIDAQFGQAFYALRAPFAECRAALDAEPEIDRDEPTEQERGEGFADARDWFDDQAPATPGRKLLGRVLLGQAFWRLEANGAARLAALRERFERRLGRRLRFERERRDDLGARLAMQEPEADSALVPPRLVERPMEVEFSAQRVSVPNPSGSKADIEAHFLQEHLRDFADLPVPALDGKTPRQAAGDPSLRKRLIHLLKPMVRQIDESNVRTGRADDINWLLRELGLAEINFPPPPLSAPPPEAPDREGDLLAIPGPNRVEARRPPQPLPPGALSEEEVVDRVRVALTEIESEAAATEELTASGATLLEDLRALTKDLFSDREFSFFITYLLHGWFALVPPGSQAPEFDFDAMVADLARELERVPSWTACGPTETLDKMTSGCRQPALLRLLMAEMFAGSDQAPKKLRPKHGALVPMIAILKAMLNEADRALRAR